MSVPPGILWRARGRALWMARYWIAGCIALGVTGGLARHVVNHGWHPPHMATAVVWLDPKAREVRGRLTSRELARRAGAAESVSFQVAEVGPDVHHVYAIGPDPTAVVTSVNNVVDRLAHELGEREVGDWHKYLGALERWSTTREGRRKEITASLDRVAASVARLTAAPPPAAGAGVVIVGQTATERQLERVLDTMRVERSALFYELLALERESRGTAPVAPSLGAAPMSILDHATGSVQRPSGLLLSGCVGGLVAGVVTCSVVFVIETVRLVNPA